MKKQHLKQIRLIANQLTEEPSNPIRLKKWRRFVHKNRNKRVEFLPFYTEKASNINHYRRLKRLFSKGYWNEAIAYCDKRDKTDKTLPLQGKLIMSLAK